MRSTVESDVLQLVFIKRAEKEEVKKINEFQMNFHLITESSLCKYLRGVSFLETLAEAQGEICVLEKLFKVDKPNGENLIRFCFGCKILMRT